MEITIDRQLLHHRIAESCLSLFENGHVAQAAAEAMKQVELALKEKSGQPGDFGRRLVRRILGGKAPVTLKVRLDQQAQEQVQTFFDGAFGYYRNYAFHDGSNITEVIAARVMIVASDLLDIIEASRLSFSGVGGVEGLVKGGFFDSPRQFYELLHWLNGQCIVDDVSDGFLEELYRSGFNEDQIHCVFDLGLVTMHQEPVFDEDLGDYGAEWIDTFEWTDQGRMVLAEGEEQQHNAKR